MRLLAIEVVFLVIFGVCESWPVAPNALGTLHELAKKIFHLDAESSVPTWFSSVQLFLIALPVSARAVILHRAKRRPWKLYALMAFGFVFLSADEVGMIHERLGWALKVPLIGRGLWPTESLHTSMISTVIYLGVTAVFAALLWRDVLALLREKPGRIPMLAGGAIYVIGAAIIDEAISYKLGATAFAAEEMYELVGQSLMLYAFLVKIGDVSLTVGGVATAPAAASEAPSTTP